MTYPLENYFGLKRTYRHGQKTFYSPKHFGVDIIVPVGTPLTAWDDVKVINRLVGSQGGLTLWVEWNGYIFRFLHLSEHGRVGSYKKGQLLGKTGNTGMSSAPHVHVDVWSVETGVTLKFEDCLDPDVIFKQSEETMEKSFVEAIEKLVGKDYGDNLNEKEQKDAAGKIDDKRKELEAAGQLEVTNKRLMENNTRLAEQITAVDQELALLRTELEQEKAKADGNAENTSIVNALVFFIKAIKSKI